MRKGYRDEPVYILAKDSRNTSMRGRIQHYYIQNGVLYALTWTGEDCLFILKGDWIHEETLRELIISQIHTIGRHRGNRNLGYASICIYWPEMMKEFRDFVREFTRCQGNKEHNTLPKADVQTLPLPSQIFSSYGINFI